MIFSLLRVRKKTSATLAGIVIAALCLWGISMWQDISLSEIFNILLATTAMVAVVMVAAILLIAFFKILSSLIRKLAGADNEDSHD
ncbi:MAG: hypothetical protein VX605_00195 [Pseudomonadota bacterium]|nr:hypothetical protein [Pseudomonadota bacterium]